MDMKIARVALLFVGLSLLAGCSAPEPEATSTPTPTTEASVNTDACASMSEMAEGLPSVINDEALTKDGWESERDKYDETALTAEGVVQERMLALVDEWPDLFDVAVMNDVTGFNEAFSAIERACAAEDVDVTFPQFTTS